MRKARHQKLFNDKFMKTIECIKPSTERQSIEDVYNYLQSNKMSVNDINYSNIQDVLSKSGNYIGQFYIKPSLANRRMLDLNIENVAQDVVTLNKQEHNDNDWAYKNNEFQKIFVMHNDGDKALIALTYNDSWSPFITNIIDTTNIYFEGNIAEQIIEYY